ncbi:hypothetical protein [Luteimonas chenhongjianii]|uniref:hypothetical protein n=1 Tax=Luteimonas chenhongjianii TaxID=2006110 RepID=UPI0012FDF441|nr:hypothetical protein [Luteimonas chenhongjianii]
MPPSVKETTEQLKAAKEIVNAVTRWAAISVIRTLVLISFVSVVILGVSYLYVDSLLERSKEATDLQNQQVLISTDQVLLRNAYNLTTECIESTQKKESLATLYCEKAEDAYLARSTIEPYKSQAMLSIQQDAHRAIRANLLSRIESNEDKLRRLAWSDPAGNTLDQLLSTNVLALFVVSVIFIVLVLYALVLRARRNVAIEHRQPEA